MEYWCGEVPVEVWIGMIWKISVGFKETLCEVIDDNNKWFFPIFWQEKKTKNFINFIKIFLRDHRNIFIFEEILNIRQ